MFIELRLAACAAMLVVAAIIDIKKREIPDKIWLGFGSFGVVLATIEFSNPHASSSLLNYLLGIGLITPIAYSVYKTGLFGGADSKALIVIAILFPWFNEWALYRLHEFTALTVLTNALLVSMSQLAFNTARNLIALSQGRSIFEGIEEGAVRKALALATGYRTNSSSGYLFPMETIDKSGKRRFVFNPARYEEFLIEQGTSDPTLTYSNDQEKGIWVTQALPFILYLAAGFALTVTVGDLLGAIIQNAQLPF